MDNNEVVGILAKNKLVEQIVWKVTSSGTTAQDPDSLDDLIQDIYLSLLEDKNIVKAYEDNHANYYVARIVMNNITSSSSRYYYKYLLPLKRFIQMDEGIRKDIDGREDD